MSIFAKKKSHWDKQKKKEKKTENLNANRSEENARNFISSQIAFIGNEIAWFDLSS